MCITSRSSLESGLYNIVLPKNFSSEAKLRDIINIMGFLSKNNWEMDSTSDDVIILYKSNMPHIHLTDEIVFIGEEGDFAHFPIDSNSVYTLIGYMLTNRLLAVDYKI